MCMLVMIHGISHSGGAPTYLQSTHTSVQHARALPSPPSPSSSSPPSSSQPLHRPSKPVWKDTLTPSEREAEKAALAKLEQKAHYLRNPKYIDLHTSLDYIIYIYMYIRLIQRVCVCVCVCVSVLSSGRYSSGLLTNTASSGPLKLSKPAASEDKLVCKITHVHVHVYRYRQFEKCLRFSNLVSGQSSSLLLSLQRLCSQTIKLAGHTRLVHNIHAIHVLQCEIELYFFHRLQWS